MVPRCAGVIAIGVLSAAALSACGSSTNNSASLSAAQDISAGIASQGAGQYAAAAQFYEKALAIQPKSAVALYNLGDVEQLQNLDAAAKSHYLAALAVDPNFISALYNLATLESSSSPLEAEALYDQVIKLSPNDASAHFNLGYVLISLGHKAAGDAEINKGIKLNPALASRVSKGASTTTTTSP
ncbi:MAG: tetratricopeptide repeat protein [Acidimicrobiales bacterium]